MKQDFQTASESDGEIVSTRTTGSRAPVSEGALNVGFRPTYPRKPATPRRRCPPAQNQADWAKSAKHPQFTHYGKSLLIKGKFPLWE